MSSIRPATRKLWIVWPPPTQTFLAPQSESLATSAVGVSLDTETHGGRCCGKEIPRWLKTASGFEPYGQESKPSTCSKVFRPITNASTSTTKLLLPQSSSCDKDFFASFSQSMLPSRRGMQTSRLVATNTEHLATIIIASGTHFIIRDAHIAEDAQHPHRDYARAQGRSGRHGLACWKEIAVYFGDSRGSAPDPRARCGHECNNFNSQPANRYLKY